MRCYIHPVCDVTVIGTLDATLLSVYPMLLVDDLL